MENQQRMYTKKRLVILDADGTTIDAFSAIARTFSQHDMNLGDLTRFQKRHNLFKYLGGVKEFPKNLRKQLTKVERNKLIDTLTAVYREEARLYPGMTEMVNRLTATPDVVVGIVTRNITQEPEVTLKQLFKREKVDIDNLDFLLHVPLKEKKTAIFEKLRDKYKVNPALCYVCGDEYKDYISAVTAAMHPMIVSYGFESFERLTEKYEIPHAIISRQPNDLTQRLVHALYSCNGAAA
jgi:phosphoglycolate phosphatase